MPRSVQKKHTEEELQEKRERLEAALAHYRQYGGKNKAVAKLYGLPPSTLRMHLLRGSTSVGAGRKRLLDDELEGDLEEAILVFQNQLRPVTQSEVLTLVGDFFEAHEKPHPWKKGGDLKPGLDWLQGFRKRHPAISLKKGEETQLGRAAAVTPATVNSWFNLVEETFKKHNITNASQVSNVDESGYDASVSAKVLAAKGKACGQAQAGSGKLSFSVAETISADGHLFPPFVIYKCKHLYDTWMRGGPPGTAYSKSENGWQAQVSFLEYFKKFVQWLNSREAVTKPHVLIMDGHTSHIQYAVAKLALANDIHLLILPGHCTHYLQPLDVGVFGPAKREWLKVKRQHMTDSGMMALNKESFPRLLLQLRENGGFPKQNIVNSFQSTGLWPLNRQRVLKKLPMTPDPVTSPPAVHQPSSMNTGLLLDQSRSSSQDPVTTPPVDHQPSGMNTGLLPDQSRSSSPPGVTPERLQFRQQLLSRIRDSKPDRDIKRTKKQKFSNSCLTQEEMLEELRKAQAEKEKGKGRKKENNRPRTKKTNSAKKIVSSDDESDTQISVRDDTDAEYLFDDSDSEVIPEKNKRRYSDAVAASDGQSNTEPVQSKLTSCLKTPPKLKVGQFVSALYQDNWFIAQVTSVTMDPEVAPVHPYMLSYLARKGPNQFVWPEKPDELLTYCSDILCPVSAPIPVTSRGFLGLSAKDLALTMKLFKGQKRV